MIEMQLRFDILAAADMIMKVSKPMNSNKKHFKNLPMEGIFFFTFFGRNGIFLIKRSIRILAIKKNIMKKVSKLLLMKFEETPNEPNQEKLFLYFSIFYLPFNRSKLRPFFINGIFFWAH